jgi:hypothetical protein
MSQEYEGWSVDHRPAVKALGLFVAVLLLLVIGTGLLYNRLYTAQTRFHPKAFPEPVLETTGSAPNDRHPLPATTPPAGIDRAMAHTAVRGDALWKD